MTHLHSLEVQAHRGDRHAFPENTLPAFQAALDSGVDLIELDVHITKDKVVIVHHNFALNSLISCNRDGSSIKNPELLCNLTLDEIKKIDCGSQTNPAFPDQLSIPGTQIPTLEEVIDLIQSSGKNTRLNIEIKRDPKFAEQSFSANEMTDLILALVEKKGFASRVQYSSFDREILIALREKAPKAILSFLFHQDSLDSAIAFATQINAQVLSPGDHLLKDSSQIDRIKKKGFKVVVWTVNDPRRWEELYNMGVDGIITDYPGELISMKKEIT